MSRRWVGFPGGASGKEPTCRCRRLKRYRFNPWVGKIPWRRTWQPTPVFLPRGTPWTEEPDELQSIGSERVGHNWSDLTHMNACKEMSKVEWEEVRLYIPGWNQMGGGHLIALGGVLCSGWWWESWEWHGWVHVLERFPGSWKEARSKGAGKLQGK